MNGIFVNTFNKPEFNLQVLSSYMEERNIYESFGHLL